MMNTVHDLSVQVARDKGIFQEEGLDLESLYNASGVEQI